MNYAGQSAALQREKHQFFSKVALLKDTNNVFVEMEQRAERIDYSFLLRHQGHIETEFNDLFALLSQDSKQKELFWFYSYYCACLLEQFHKGYSQPEKVAHYQALKEQIKKRVQGTFTETKAAEQTFIQFLYETFVANITRLTSMPFHLSKIRDEVVYANLCRIHWVFNRLTLVQGLKVANAAQLIEQLDWLLGTHTDVDQLIATIQAPVGMVNYFSVGFFLTRFFIDGALVLKHSFFPSELEKSAERGSEINKLPSLPSSAEQKAYLGSYLLVDTDLYYLSKKGELTSLSFDTRNLTSLFAEDKSIYCSAQQIKELITEPTGHVPEKTTAYERFLHELYKRHCNFANDLVWATVNFLTNFNSISGISDPVAGYLIATFLVFDIGMLCYKQQLAFNDYQQKKEYYERQKSYYSDSAQTPLLNDLERQTHLELLDKQLAELQINWQSNDETLRFLILAATLLMATFGVAMLLSNPVLLTAGFFVCTVGVAMYLSSNDYHTYQQARLRHDNEQQAWQNFMLTMVKNSFLPLVLLATYSVCFPAGVALSVTLMGAGLVQTYQGTLKKETFSGEQEEELPVEENSPREALVIPL